MPSPLAFTALGAAGAVGARSLFVRALQAQLRRGLAKLNAGDYRELLDGYAEDAVLVFAEGDHRWAGEHRGKAAIERFFQDFVAAGVRGELSEVMVSGPPWALRMTARFDDHVTRPDGEVIYRNRVVLHVRTRWGKIVRHEDFYEDTARILAFDRRLTALGVEPVAVPA